jgi:hypothetical protein
MKSIFSPIDVEIVELVSIRAKLVDVEIVELAQ